MRRTRGFTLLELLIVMVVIGILVMLAFPQYNRFVDQSKETEALNIIGSLLNAEYMYFQEKGVFTDAYADLSVVVKPNLRYWDLGSGLNVSSGANAAVTNILGTVYVGATASSNASHAHAAVNDHNIVGWIGPTGTKVYQHKRPNETTAINF